MPVDTQRLTMKEVIRYIKSTKGRELSLSTITRWGTRGVVNRRTKKHVFLRRSQVGGEYYTTAENVEDFIARLNEG